MAGVLVKAKSPGINYYFSSRNNAFSNRRQVGTIKIIS
jgi:hypothetical protein